MILFKTAFNNLRKNLCLNFFVFIQFTTLLIITAVMISSLYLRYRTYLPFKDYFESNGMFCLFEQTAELNSHYTDTEAMLSELSAEDAIAAHKLYAIYNNSSGTNREITEQSPVVYSYDDEIISRFSPDLSKGRWISPNSDEIEAVVSENSWFKTGEKITLSLGSNIGNGVIEFREYTIRIVGELKSDTEVFLCGRSFANPSYKNAFYPYSLRTEGVPLMLLSYSSLERYGNEIYQPIYEFAIIKYDDNASEESMKKDRETLMQNGSIAFFSLQEMDENSKSYLSEQLYTLLPILIVLMIMTMVSCISSSAITTRKRLRDYANYCLVGLTRGKCILINLIQSLIIASAALIAAKLCIEIIRFTTLSEIFVVIDCSWLIVAELAVIAIVVCTSLIMPVIMLCSSDIKQLLHVE